MMSVILVLLPIVLAILVAAGGRNRQVALAVAPWAPVLLLWPVYDYGAVTTLSWPLDGIRLGTDEASRPILLLTSIVWTLAGLMASSVVKTRVTLFWSGWLSSLTGMSLVLLGGDIISFYLGYAVLSLSSFLLVIHQGNPQAWRAGYIYLIMALTGEAAILTGILLIAGVHGNLELAQLVSSQSPEVHPAAAWLLIAGFAVKLGILPLHVWLPLAHPIAPVPASAILSAVIVKAGLMGWIRVIPINSPGVAELTSILITLGLVTAFGGIVLGLGQRRIKTMLAYSTISQMGLVLAGFALIFRMPEERAALVTMIGFLALHHGLNKASLFMACGCAPGLSRWRMLLVALPALSLAAAPLTTGFLAKELFKESLYAVGLASTVAPVVTLTSTATAILMWKVFQLAGKERNSRVPAHPAWIAATAFALLMPWVWATTQSLVSIPVPEKLWSATWPLLLAAGLIVVWRHLPILRHLHWQLPEGDWIVMAERFLSRTRYPFSTSLVSFQPGRWAKRFMRRTHRFIDWLEQQLGWMPIAGLIMLLATAVLWWLLYYPHSQTW